MKILREELMGTRRLARASIFFLVFLFPNFLFGQTLTLEPASPPATSQEKVPGLASSTGEAPASPSFAVGAERQAKPPMTLQVEESRQQSIAGSSQDSNRAPLAPTSSITSVDLQATVNDVKGDGDLPPTGGSDTTASFSEGEGGRATLAAQVRPSSAAPSPGGSIELQATKAPSAASFGDSLETPWGMVLALLLFLFLFGNLFQFYRHRVFVGTVGNELLTAFNSIAWSLERCFRKRQDLDAQSSQKVTDPVMLREFREFALESEFMLRTLREQLGTVARNLRYQDRVAKSYPVETPTEDIATAEKPLSQDPESRTA